MQESGFGVQEFEGLGHLRFSVCGSVFCMSFDHLLICSSFLPSISIYKTTEI